eukprot:6064568-Prymnesium_polylepis.1
MDVWELVSVRRSPQMKSLNSQRQLMVASAVTNKLGDFLAVSPLGFKNKETGMINEFAFHWAKRTEFPLHYFVFRTRPTWSRSSPSAAASLTRT